jgi:uncharacterized protein (DUF2141 family)
MTIQKVVLIAICLIITIPISAQTEKISLVTLDIEVQGITKGGILNLEISSSKEAFESDGDNAAVVARIQERVSRGSYKQSFEIPPGTYAVKLHIDENENGELDTNFLGIPKEQYGISNNGRFLNFKAASFIIDTYKKVQIEL